MINKKTIVSCALLISLIDVNFYASRAGFYSTSLADKENCDETKNRDSDFEYAERLCNIAIYSAALQKYMDSFHDRISVPGLHKIIQSCSKSGNLNKLVQTNIAAGGNPTELCHRQKAIIIDHYIAHESSSPIDWQQYHGAALGILCMQEMQNLSPEQTADISNTVDTLIGSGCKIDKGLFYACYYGNMTVAQMLMSRGANLYKPVKDSCHQRAPISSAQGLVNKIKLMALQIKVSFSKRHASLDDIKYIDQPYNFSPSISDK